MQKGLVLASDQSSTKDMTDLFIWRHLPMVGGGLSDVLVRNGRRQPASQVNFVYPEASQSGFKGDVIAVLIKTIQSLDDLNAYLSTLPPEGQIKLSVLRQGKTVLTVNAAPRHITLPKTSSSGFGGTVGHRKGRCSSRN